MTLALPADPLGIMDSWLDKIEVRLYRNSYSDETLLEKPFMLSRRRSVSVLLNLRLSPGETILGAGTVSRRVTVEVDTKEVQR
ncbi:MAG: hypothetical protein ACLQDL_10325 [Spirochaetia bacterium]